MGLSKGLRCLKGLGILCLEICEMAYEVYKRTSIRVEEPTVSITPYGRIYLNAAAVRVLKSQGVKSVLLLWDDANKKVALKAAAARHRDAYTVSIVPDAHSGSLKAKSFLSFIGWHAQERTTLRATWNDKEKMLEVSLPWEHVSSARADDKKFDAQAGSKPPRD
jgi:hypothetical protein